MLLSRENEMPKRDLSISTSKEDLNRHSRYIVGHHDRLRDVAWRDVPTQKFRFHFCWSQFFEINFLVSLSVSTGGHITLQFGRKRGFICKQRQRKRAKKPHEFILEENGGEKQEEEK